MLPDRGSTAVRLWLIAAVLLSLISYYLLVYQTSRTDFSSILIYYLVLSTVYILVIRTLDANLLQWALAAAILFRISMLLAVPELSDDFYRFIWDGRLLAQGISPFADLPSELMADPLFNASPLDQLLYEGMNSPNYFTVYPPVSQMIFLLAAKIFPDSITGNVIIMRLVILLCEAGSLWLIIKILKGYGLQSKKVLVYAWNPLVIIELTGNLHFEAIMIFFVLLAIYGLQKNQWKLSATSMGAAIATKLIPLIFLPLLVFRMTWRKVAGYWLLCGAVVLLFFLSVWNPELIDGMRSSLTLYFQKFEFNASIYYLVREIGYVVKGYNVIQEAGRLMPLITLLIILAMSWYSGKIMSWPNAMLLALTVYLLLATTVHPWYITPLVALAVFSELKFPIVWSLAIIVSYAGYTEKGFHENLILVVVEYLLVLIAALWDIRKAIAAGVFVKT
ncbi:MAG: hypothetical protein DHS20C17_31210 [Cyclobacteriaceae bacterium]|nr:MAG: hypothetical protein DHS20C17_31210 [Cyclobacteriaceae bacterium]